MKQDPRLRRAVLAGHRVEAISVAGVQTCIQLPELDLCFDIGRCPVSAVHRRTVLITHGHVDHLGGLIHHVSLRSLWRMAPSRIVVPAELAADVEELLALWRRVSHTELPAEVLPIAPGDRLALPRGVSVRAVRASHRVPTLAYLLDRTRSTLRPDLVGIPGPDIAAKRASGESVTVERTVSEVAFTADTRALLLDREPALYEARLLICECTFVPGNADDFKARADRTGHVSLADLAARADRFHNEAVLLTHFSTRYGAQQIREGIDTLPAALRGRVTALPLLVEAPEGAT